MEQFWIVGNKRKGGLLAKSSPGGGEENRTPVQTYSSKAFYMFIC